MFHVIIESLEKDNVLWAVIAPRIRTMYVEYSKLRQRQRNEIFLYICRKMCIKIKKHYWAYIYFIRPW
jgi:hypothetical protein